jgi:hypothetical protein
MKYTIIFLRSRLVLEQDDYDEHASTKIMQCLVVTMAVATIRPFLRIANCFTTLGQMSCSHHSLAYLSVTSAVLSIKGNE